MKPVKPVRPQAVFTEIKGIPKADEIDAFVPEPVAGGQQVIVAADQANLTPPAEESPSPHESRGNTTAHKNFRRFQKLFPEIVSGQYESLRLEAGDAYDPLVIHHKYGDHYCMEHYYIRNVFAACILRTSVGHLIIFFPTCGNMQTRRFRL